MTNLRSDRGPQFASHTWLLVCEKMGIQPRKIVAYRPQGNPRERANRTIKPCIKACAQEHRDWDKNLPAISFALRTAINETTKHTPAMLTYGRELRSPFSVPAPDPPQGFQPNPIMSEEYETKLKSRMADTIAKVQANCRRAQARQAKYYNIGRRPPDLKVGDWVLSKTNILSDAAKGVTSSLAPLFAGPFRLSQRISENVYELETEDGEYAGTKNVDQLREFHQPVHFNERPEDSSSDDSDSVDSQDMIPVPAATVPDADEIPPQRPEEKRPQRARNIPSKFQDYVMESM
jgi:hypothetical protein